MKNKDLKPVFVNRQNLDNMLNSYKDGAGYLQSFVNAYQSLDIGNLEKNELEQLLKDPKTFLFGKILGDRTVDLGGVKLDNEKLFDIVEKPKGLDELMSLINEHYHRKESINLRDYQINEANQVVVSEERKEALEYLNSVYLTTETQKNAHKALVSIAENLEILKNSTGGYLDMDNLKHFFKRVAVNGETNTHYWGFTLNYDRFKSIK